MSQGRQSACIPPPSDYSQQTRSPGQIRYKERSDRGGYRAGRADFPSSRGYHYGQHNRHQPTKFQRDQPEHYDEQLEGFEGEKTLPKQPKDRFHRNDDDDYFARVQDDDDEEEESSKKNTDTVEGASNDIDADEDEDDPLDAYMRSLEANETQKDGNENSSQIHEVPESAQKNPSLSAGPIRLDIDASEDIEESYYQYVEQQKGHSQVDHDEYSDERQDLIEYDRDGNVIAVKKVKRDFDPLPSVDHAKIEYNSFERCLYHEHEDIAKLSSEQSEELRKKLEIKVSGQSPPRPVCSFAHFNFEEKLMKVIRRSEYVQPTPIQAQAIPTALSGRNLIGIAVTGSGKTAAYLWPMVVHISRQPALEKGDGPIGLILVPTRELALQVYSEAKKFSSSYKQTVVCAYGGGSRFEQGRDLESGAEIVVATPGRLIDLIKSNVTNLKRVTYLVLDEADRFFDMGFEVQVRSICDHIRPDRQTLLFSATFKHKVEQLARTVTENPIKIVQKNQGEANEDVSQHTVVFRDASKRWEWLLSHLVEFTSAGSVLIFVTRIINSEELHKKLEESGKDCLLLHGDMEQSERNRVIMCFKRKEKDVLVATDVAARGLDISHIRTVINYDVARDIDTHTHRIGRTGRAGSKGDAYTLLSSDKDKDFAGQLVKNLEASNQRVDESLLKLAMQSHAFRKFRQPRASHSQAPDQHRSRQQQYPHIRDNFPGHRSERNYTNKYHRNYNSSRPQTSGYHDAEQRNQKRARWDQGSQHKG